MSTQTPESEPTQPQQQPTEPEPQQQLEQGEQDNPA
jgi:hypothetical protein